MAPLRCYLVLRLVYFGRTQLATLLLLLHMRAHAPPLMKPSAPRCITDTNLHQQHLMHDLLPS